MKTDTTMWLTMAEARRFRHEGTKLKAVVVGGRTLLDPESTRNAEFTSCTWLKILSLDFARSREHHQPRGSSSPLQFFFFAPLASVFGDVLCSST